IIFDPLVKGRILQLGSIDDHQLDWLYRNCLFTVYPSFYEGWGLPVGESLWYGKCCVASNATSIPEIGGTLVDYHDPFDFEECYRLIRRSIVDIAYRTRREEEIRKTYQPTTWRACAESIYQVIRAECGCATADPASLHAGNGRQVVEPS